MPQAQSETTQHAAGQTGKGATNRTDPKSDPADPKNPQNGANPASGSDPTEMLKSDHRHVEQLFSSYEKATDNEQKSQFAEQICTELMVHTLLEEEIFYPACRDHMEQRILEEAQVEHDGAKTLIIEIKTGSPTDQYFDAKVKVLSEEIKHHVREEEKPDGVLAKAKQAGVATPDLAKRMAALKHELMGQAKAGALGPPETRSFHVRTFAGMHQLSQEHKMARGSSMTMERERDERGRFVSDDDHDYRRRSSSRSQYDDDDRRSSRSRSMPARDDEGRFTSSRSRYDDDDDDRRSSRSRSRYEEDDDDRRGSRGHGGWYGDPEGHSEASRRGWNDRGGSRSHYRDDDRRRTMPARDDEGRFMSSRSRYDDDDDDRRGSGGHGGWYGDPEGHSEASRRGWDERGGSGSRYRDDDRPRSMPARDDEGRFMSSRSRYDDDDDDRRGGRGHGGWYGDPEGHSEASRRGWEERGGSRSRSRYDDDDDDRRGSRGHGGWYGDPEGHSQAARRGRR
jgi:Hemerythrin HHE cation binding domain